MLMYLRHQGLDQKKEIGVFNDMLYIIFKMLPEMKVYHQSNVGKKESFTFLFELFLKNLFSWDRDLLLVSGSSLQI